MTMAATVKSYLEGRGVNWEPLHHAATGSSHESAQAAHVDEGHIAKAVMVHDAAGAVMAVIPADTWLKLPALCKALDRELDVAPEEAAARYFPDCARGAIPPLGPAYGIETVLDESLTSLAYVYLEAGDHQTLLRVSGREFLDLLGGVRHEHICESD